jgi:hypothetical protein
MIRSVCFRFVFFFWAARKMSFRRFLNLVSKDSLKCVYTLRHMDTSRLFLPTISNKGIGGGRSTPMEDDCRPLPEPVANFYSSHCPGDAGQMTFMDALRRYGDRHGPQRRRLDLRPRQASPPLSAQPWKPQETNYRLPDLLRQALRH